MRRVGRISSWNDEKGYGFVVPHDGGERAFVHIKAFELASRRPIDGDLISYSISKDDRGRPNATAIRFAGQKNVGRHFGSRSEERAGPRLPWPVPRLMIGSLSLVAITCGAILGDVPVVILLAYFIASSLSYIFYALDKMYAGKRMWRVPEQLLHIVDLLCGWPGALIAQQQFRHKTAKKSFQSMFWTTVVFNAAAVAWLMNSETARALIRRLSGVEKLRSSAMKYLHTMVRVSDLDASLRFYRDALGLEELSRRDYPQGRFTLVFLAAPGDHAAQIELTHNWDPEAYTGGRNFGHVAYAVPDIHAACARLQDHGVTINRPPRDGRMAFVRSPDGISIELLQDGPELTPIEPWLSMPNTGTW